ncbi:Cytoskeletal signaling protein slm1 [Penicillium ucsense]|uniref:Cytoskeletal signaling protein slm1 n=1 Tax=Penicillium ucsense TaxID=2839758 RepID=A0A8J8W7K1_9EURO|nr:Cytoskeletal signaling protein slm1 [Penicillium ucsense]KAF7737219.1 Cytoskeletal signaling protein slm1 [Penicillium ucsense]
MSTSAHPTEQGHSLPSRSATVQSSMTRQTSASDDELTPDNDSNETTSLLMERLRAWKHMCGNLEDYVSTTAKITKSQAKDYEKVLKTVNEPLREGDHFSAGTGGINTLFETIRNQSQISINSYLEVEKNLRGSVLPVLERLHKEIKNKSKELKSGTSTGSKAVEKARQATQKHVELLGQHSALVESGASNKTDTQHDPYVLRRGINHRLHKQVAEENNHRNDILAIQNSFSRFEAHVLQTIQTALEQFHQIMGGQLDRQRSSYADILNTAQRIPPDFEWVNFCMNNESKLVNADSPLRAASAIQFPNMDHRTTQPVIEGSLERRSRAMLKGYNTGYYVVTPAGFLHEFKDNDDLRKDPTPELSLYLPDCVVGAVDGVKFNVKGKDVSSNKVGNAFHTSSELSFKAHSASDAEKWWSVLSEYTKGSAGPTAAAAAGAGAGAAATSPTGAAATSPTGAAATSPTGGAAAPSSAATAAAPGTAAASGTAGAGADPAGTAAAAPGTAAVSPGAAATAEPAYPSATQTTADPAHAASANPPPVYNEKAPGPSAAPAATSAPTQNLNRSASSGSHFHGAPGGSGV